MPENLLTALKILDRLLFCFFVSARYILDDLLGLPEQGSMQLKTNSLHPTVSCACHLQRKRETSDPEHSWVSYTRSNIIKTLKTTNGEKEMKNHPTMTLGNIIYIFENSVSLCVCEMATLIYYLDGNNNTNLYTYPCIQYYI